MGYQQRGKESASGRWRKKQEVSNQMKGAVLCSVQMQHFLWQATRTGKLYLGLPLC